jgi:hypothetical protein
LRDGRAGHRYRGGSCHHAGQDIAAAHTVLAPGDIQHRGSDRRTARMCFRRNLPCQPIFLILSERDFKNADKT